MDFSDLGRKWRAALMQLGFITPNSKRLARNGLAETRPYSVTENGQRLIESSSLPAQQECFLRSLLAHQLPSAVERFSVLQPFNPLRIVLTVLRELEKAGTDSYLDKVEMAAVVQLVTDVSNVPDAIERIIRYRHEIAAAKRPRQKDLLRERFLRSAHATQGVGSLNDYADSNFRYLRLTGLFKPEEKRLRLSPHRRTLIESIVAAPFEALDGKDYLHRFWTGSQLPTDNRNTAAAAVRETAVALEVAGESVTLPVNLSDQSAANLQQLSHELQEKLLRAQEEKYAALQQGQWENIIEYLDTIASGGKRIPAGQVPAYFEWAIWRAFLAIDSLKSKPWDCRKFNVYQGAEPFESFLPEGCARSGGPDLVFEFDTFVVVVEVTLTSGGRQEGAEGEPVRRHVAEYVDAFGEKKRVYGLFIALSVNANTAETFRVAKWYRKDESEVRLKIVPLTLAHFISVFKAAFSKSGTMDHRLIEELLEDCLAEANAAAPAWKRAIDKRVDRFISTQLSPAEA